MNARNKENFPPYFSWKTGEKSLFFLPLLQNFVKSIAIMQTWKEGDSGEATGMVRFAGVGMFRALNSTTEVEGDLDAARSSLVTLQLGGEESVADGPRGWHRPHLDPVDLLAGGALEELPGRAVDELLETGAVVGVAALGESQGGPVIVSQADGTLLSTSSTSGPGHGVGADQVTSTGASYGWLGRRGGS